MSMTDIFRSLGRSDALKLREESATLSETEIVDLEHCVPAFDPQRNYTDWPVGAPVTDEGQVWLLLQPHNAAHYPDLRPSTNRACWGLAHTTNPAKAKPWVDAYGTSGVYMKGEVYKDTDGVVHRAKQDNLVYDAAAYPDGWELVS